MDVFGCIGYTKIHPKKNRLVGLSANFFGQLDWKTHVSVSAISIVFGGGGNDKPEVMNKSWENATEKPFAGSSFWGTKILGILGSIHPWKPRSGALSPKKTAPSNNNVKTNIYSKTRVITVITCHHRKEIARGCLYVKQHLCIYSFPDGDLHMERCQVPIMANHTLYM